MCSATVFLMWLTLSPLSLRASSEDWEEVRTAITSYSCPHSPTASVSDFGTFQSDDVVICSENTDPHVPDLTDTRPKANDISGGGGMVSGQAAYDQCFDFGDGNICVSIGTYSFLLHQFKLEEFLDLSSRIESARNHAQEGNTATSSILKIILDEDPEDFGNLLNVLYTSVYNIPPQGYSIAVLKSTLRLATKFQHSALRTFAISQLRERNLTPIERIFISRQSSVPSWMERALDELCTREQPISLEEARILGTETFVHVAARREAYKSKLRERPITFKGSLYETPQQPDTPGDELSELYREGGFPLPTLQPPRSALASLITSAFSTVDSIEFNGLD